MSDLSTIRHKLLQIDLVFVIDTTASMGTFILEVSKQLQIFAQRLVNDKVKPNVLFGVVAYRDHRPEDITYVTNVLPLSDVTTAHSFIGKLNAVGGGDVPEAVLDGINSAIQKMQWREHSHRVVLLAGDAPPHGEGDTGDKFPKGCPCGLTPGSVIASARKTGVIIHAIGVGSYELMITTFTHIANETGGIFIPLAKVDTLIDKILALLLEELGKISTDIETIGTLRTTNNRTATELANVSGKDTSEVEASLFRLRDKGALSAEEIATLFGDKGALAILDPSIDTRIMEEIIILDDEVEAIFPVVTSQSADAAILNEIIITEDHHASAYDDGVIIQDQESDASGNDIM